MSNLLWASPSPSLCPIKPTTQWNPKGYYQPIFGLNPIPYSYSNSTQLFNVPCLSDANLFGGEFQCEGESK